MTQTLITIERADLDGIKQELQRLHQRLDAVQMAPRPEWLTVKQYAQLINKSERTVTRMINDGKLHTDTTGDVLLIHVSLAA